MAISSGSTRARKKFLRYFPKGFRDETYIDWERGYKWNAHEQWLAVLAAREFKALLAQKKFAEIAAHAVRIESGHEFAVLVREDGAARCGEIAGRRAGIRDRPLQIPPRARRRGKEVHSVARLPRRQTRVLTWPLVTIWGFIAQPERHFFLKPNVTRRAADAYGFDFQYQSKPIWETYAHLLEFAEAVRHDLRDLRPRDMIDIQSFLWVQGSDEYPD